MHVKLVHVQRKLCFPILPAQVFQVVGKLRLRDCCIVDVVVLETRLSRHCHYHRLVALVHLLLVDGQVGVLGTPLSALQSPLRKVDLVEPKNLPSFGNSSVNLVKLLALALCQVVCDVAWPELFLADYLALDVVRQVQSAQRSHCYTLVGKLAVEEQAAFGKSPSRPKVERVFAEEEVELRLLKFTVGLVGLFPLCFKSLPTEMLH